MPSNRKYNNYYKPNFYPTVAKDENRVAKPGKNSDFLLYSYSKRFLLNESLIFMHRFRSELAQYGDRSLPRGFGTVPGLLSGIKSALNCYFSQKTEKNACGLFSIQEAWS